MKSPPLPTQSRDLTRFDPPKIKQNQAKIDAVAQYAKTTGDWPLLEEAIEIKIQEQAEFVAWWQENVTPHERGHSSVTVLKPKEIDDWKVTVHRWGKSLRDLERYKDRLLGAEYRAANLTDKKFYGNHENENEELYTPEKYVEAARLVLKEFDLDPASSLKAQETVKATKYFTKKDNALTKDWIGRIWLNPPYSQPALTQFVDKLIAELTAGRVSEAILLTNNHTDTAWFHHAESIAALICFTQGRVKFIDALQGEKMPTAGQAFFYYGDNQALFSEIFKPFGFIR